MDDGTESPGSRECPTWKVAWTKHSYAPKADHSRDGSMPPIESLRFRGCCGLEPHSRCPELLVQTSVDSDCLHVIELRSLASIMRCSQNQVRTLQYVLKTCKHLIEVVGLVADS